VTTERIDCAVIGAGVVGLAVARELALAGREVVVIEAATAIGTGTSSRNSEVIHAGIYYAPGSWKARLCVEGKQRLYAYCEERGVPYRRCGKLIAATSQAQHAALDVIAARAQQNGVDDLRRLSRDEARAIEPALECTAALHSPSTGIVDSHVLMHQLLGDAESGGATVAFGSRVVGGQVGAHEIVLDVQSGDGTMSLAARDVVNAAGLHAPQVAATLRGLPADAIPKPFFAKGNYYSLAGRSPFSRLVYPVPEPGGLGIHLTLDLGGQARFGPDVEWLDIEQPEQIDFDVDPRRGDVFYASIRRYWPALPDGALQPSYAGVRPKIARGSEADFLIQGAAQHGVPGLVELFGIESPGLTASLAIARHVRELLVGST
jgi:L-2-hydroxyglutarate oxidase LhgO